MDDLIRRQQAIDIASGYCHPANIADELRKLPSAQHKIAREDIEEYCRRRNMVLITGELFKEMRTRWSRPEIIYCKDCKFTDGEKPIADGRYWCVLHESFMYFCSDAERRTDGSD